MQVKKIVIVTLMFTTCFNLFGCGGGENSSETTPSASVSTPTVTSNLFQAPTGSYFSETTGLPISTDLQNQRPIAVMVDCESVAFPHYGISEADIVYDLRNSMKNDYITRFMVVYKDYSNIPQIGSIRSTRPTNVWLAGEWNAILCHVCSGLTEMLISFFRNDVPV